VIARYILREKRKARSLLMLRARQAKRDALGIDAETARWRAMRDARDAVKKSPARIACRIFARLTRGAMCN